MVIDVRARRVLAQTGGQQVQRQIVAAEEDEQSALAFVGKDHEVDRVGACRGAVELLDVTLGRPGLDQFHEPGLLETQDVVTHPGRVMTDDDSQLGERRRTRA